MSRSAVDATRFTATSPHAYSKPSSRFTSSPPSHLSPPPSSGNNRFSPSHHGSPFPAPAQSAETPAQKVARLRAARQAAREGEVSRWDRIVVRGRVWADRAHRFTVLGLMGVTVLAGGVTLFALTDMIIYNRRKRNLYYAEQSALYTAQLSAAQAAFASDPNDLTEDQTLLLNRERARREGEERKKQGKGWGKWLVGGLKNEEDVGEIDGDMKIVEGGEGGVLDAVRTEEGETGTEGGVLKALEEKRRNGEKRMEAEGVHGGPLDELAEQAVEAGRAKGGWTSWAIRK